MCVKFQSIFRFDLFMIILTKENIRFSSSFIDIENSNERLMNLKNRWKIRIRKIRSFASCELDVMKLVVDDIRHVNVCL